MNDRDLEHPDISVALRTGYPTERRLGINLDENERNQIIRDELMEREIERNERKHTTDSC